MFVLCGLDMDLKADVRLLWLHLYARYVLSHLAFKKHWLMN